ncbi:MAG TPA: hypothetical protein VFZ16_21050 [Hyphomicrobiaceae bacterium]|nr:hypothetical protein [Hyphomicrobiaceae bacterium]
MQTVECKDAVIESTMAAGGAVRRRAAPGLHWAGIPCALAAMLWQAPLVHADTLFDSLRGSWSGTGHIRYDNGQSEGIRCNAYYTGEGAKLRMAIRCNSGSTKVEIRGQLTAQGKRLTGTWEERTFNASGQATGSVSADKMKLSISGGGFKGSMQVASAGKKQTVTILTEGIRMKSVTVTLGKS